MPWTIDPHDLKRSNTGFSDRHKTNPRLYRLNKRYSTDRHTQTPTHTQLLRRTSLNLGALNDGQAMQIVIQGEKNSQAKEEN